MVLSCFFIRCNFVFVDLFIFSKFWTAQLLRISWSNIFLLLLDTWQRLFLSSVSIYHLDIWVKFHDPPIVGLCHCFNSEANHAKEVGPKNNIIMTTLIEQKYNFSINRDVAIKLEEGYLCLQDCFVVCYLLSQDLELEGWHLQNTLIIRQRVRLMYHSLVSKTLKILLEGRVPICLHVMMEQDNEFFFGKYLLIRHRL